MWSLPWQHHDHVLTLWTELAASGGPLSHLPQRVCPFSSGDTHEVRAALSGTAESQCFSHRHHSNHIKLNFNSLTLCDFRVLISAALICPDWICVTSISRWPIWAAATWRTPTCAALTWSGPISPEPTWTWVWKQFSGRHWVIHVHVQCQQTALHTSHSGEVNISFFCLYCLWCFCVIFLPAGEQKTFRFSVFLVTSHRLPPQLCGGRTLLFLNMCANHTHLLPLSLFKEMNKPSVLSSI